MRGEAGLRADLAALGIPFAQAEHQAVFTVEQSRTIDKGLPGAHTKNLFLKESKGGFLLATVPAAAHVDLTALTRGLGRRRVSFGKAEDMGRLLGVTPGSVTPLAMINAAPGSVTVIIEEGLAKEPRVNVHPLRNTATIGLSGADLIDLLVHWGHRPLIAPIPIKDTP